MDEKNRTASPAKRVAVGKEEQGSERSFRRRQKRSRADFATMRCWEHVRRKFDEALNALPPDRREGTTAYTGLEYCNKLFAWEEQFKGLSPEERAKQRLREETPILDALLEWADSVSAAPKSALGKALHYLKEQWPYLLRYLEDGRPELSNNWAERSIKPFVIGRKNFLFANTPLGRAAAPGSCA